MKTRIQEFISGKRIAVVGASRTNDKYKFGNMAAEELKRRGYEISFVHPQAETINGEAAYPSLSALPGKVDGVLVSLPASKSGPVLQDAAAAGLRNVWIQQGGESPELIQLGGTETESGDGQVHPDVCTTGAQLPYHPPLHCPCERPTINLSNCSSWCANPPW
jgi:predicted CoA-binding protein